MILPIYAYGHPVLKKMGEEIDKDYASLNELIDNMWDTMYHAKGVGLAAPQVGLAIRLFIVDTLQINKDEEDAEKKAEGIKKVFINPSILDETGNLWSYEEGCLSIPNILGDVERPANVHIKYFDENFIEYTESYDGMEARVIQHEYDHIEGKLFIEKVSPLKKKLIARKLENIKKGNVTANYRLKFY
jgi:peptide deformylase